LQFTSFTGGIDSLFIVMGQLAEFFSKLFDYSDWPARWHCGRWTDFHGWLYIISDLMVWSAYFAIPLIIIRYVVRQRKRIRFDRLYLLFAAFILACGATHFIDALMFWVPMYRVSALIRLITGLLSWMTVFYLIKKLPLAFTLKTTKELEREVEAALQKERALQQQNRLLNESQQIVSVGAWEWDVKTGKITWSDEQYRIWGLPKGSQLAYDEYIKTIHPADREYTSSHITRALETKEYSTFYHRIITPRGEVRHILARGEVDVDEGGEPKRITGTAQDVTQLKEEELQLLAKTLQLERKAGDLEQFAYIASHDLQEPLRKISTFATMLQSSADLGHDKQGALIEKIVKASDRMQQLVNDILDFSRVSNDKLSFQKVNLNATLRMVQADMELLINSTGTDIMADKMPEIEGVPPQLHQVFQNIISNAIKFRKEGVAPEIRISSEALTGKQLDKEERGWVRSFVPEMSDEHFEDLPFCRISISDNGIGFDQKYADKIFQIFQRLHGRSEYEGTGIGLAICRRILENHHGMISANAEHGRGATFHLLLPLSQTPFKHVS
jgi:signal transduction histidine kinase